MTAPCMHGFQSGQCAACDTCSHGLIASRCGECLADAREAASPSSLVEERAGWEIFYVPELSGWQVRAPERDVLPDSYRSLFLARKAVDRLGEVPTAGARSKQPK